MKRPEARDFFQSDLLNLRSKYRFDPVQIANAMAIWDRCAIEKMSADESLLRIVPVLAKSKSEQEGLTLDLNRLNLSFSGKTQSYADAPTTFPNRFQPKALAVLAAVISLIVVFMLTLGLHAVLIIFIVLFLALLTVVASSTLDGMILWASSMFESSKAIHPYRRRAKTPILWDESNRRSFANFKFDNAWLNYDFVPPEGFAAAAEALQRHIQVSSRGIDVKASLRKTIKRGGLLSTVMSSRRARPETLFVIERLSPNDHLAAHYTRAVKSLMDLGSTGSIYHYSKNPRRLIPYKRRGVETPETISSSPEQQRIIVFGSPQRFLSNRTMPDENAIVPFNRWRYRMMLDPSRSVEPIWSLKEMRLARQGWRLGAARDKNFASLSTQIEATQEHNLLAGRPAPASFGSSILDTLLSESSDNPLVTAFNKSDLKLVVCCDAALAADTESNTSNIYRLYRELEYNWSKDQRVYYVPGIGSNGYIKYRVDKYHFDVLGVADWNFESSLRIVYTQLAKDYEPGCKIFLFGAARGGSLAWHIANLIRFCGLPSDASEAHIEQAISMYRQHWTSDPDAIEMIAFRRRFSPRFATSRLEQDRRDEVGVDLVSIAYLGLWQTYVPATLSPLRHFANLSKANRIDVLPVNLNAFILAGRQALGLDSGRSADRAKASFESLQKEILEQDYSQLQQLFFPGDARTVTGKDENFAQADAAFRWVVEGAKRAGLATYLDTYIPIDEYTMRMKGLRWILSNLRIRRKRHLEEMELHPLAFSMIDSFANYNPLAPISSTSESQQTQSDRHFDK